LSFYIHTVSVAVVPLKISLN